MGTRSYFAVFLIFVAPLRVIAQVAAPEDGMQWWAYKDSTKYKPTGYIAANFGYIDEDKIIDNPTVSIAGALPLKNHNYGFTGKLGYNSLYVTNASSKYNQYYISGGLFLTFQLDATYSFDIKLQGGIMYNHYPEQNYTTYNGYSRSYGTTVYDSTISSDVKINSVDAFSFLLQGGIGFRYRISHRIGILLNVDYMLMRAEFSSTFATSNTLATITNYNSATGISTTYGRPLPGQNYTIPYTFEQVNQKGHGYASFTLGIYYQL